MSVVQETSGLQESESQRERFFAPNSISWRIVGHPVALIGGMRALIIQTLHPLAMAGVAQYSDFRADPLKRLRGTSAYVASVVFGDRATALAAASRVKKLHVRVRGTDPVTGREFNANDPETMLWVHCTEIHSFLAAYRAYAGSLTLEERDRYLAEQVTAAELIGIPRAMVPHSTATYRKYFAEIRPHLCCSAEAAETIDFIVRAKLRGRTPLDLRLAALLFGPAAAALVPRDLRRIAGLPDRGPSELPRRAINNVAWRVAPMLGRVPVVRDVLDGWATKLVGETPVKLALHQMRDLRKS
jgi:uncharacterized protein (DUF2236 family)